MEEREKGNVLYARHWARFMTRTSQAYPALQEAIPVFGSRNQSRTSQTSCIIQWLAAHNKLRTRMHHQQSRLTCQALRPVLRLLRDRRYPPSRRRGPQPIKNFTNARRHPLHPSGSCGPPQVVFETDAHHPPHYHGQPHVKNFTNQGRSAHRYPDLAA